MAKCTKRLLTPIALEGRLSHCDDHWSRREFPQAGRLWTAPSELPIGGTSARYSYDDCRYLIADVELMPDASILVSQPQPNALEKHGQRCWLILNLSY